MIKLSCASRFKHVYSHFHFFGLADAMFSSPLCKVFADEEKNEPFMSKSQNTVLSYNNYCSNLIFNKTHIN